MRDGKQYLAFLSDFWTSLWTDSKSLGLVLGTEIELLNRVYFQAIQVAAPLVVDTMPIFREDFWHILTISTLDRIDTTNAFTLAASYVHLPYLYDRIIEPVVRLAEGAGKDFTIVARDGVQTILFASDPFADGRNPIRDLGTERQLLFYAPRVLTDEGDLFNTFGWLTRIEQPSSENYRQLVEGVMRIYNAGPVIKILNAGLNLAAGYPYSRANGVDRVIGITNDFENYHVTTQQGFTYDVPLIAELAVAIGTLLSPFDTFIRDIRVMDFKTDPEWWRGGPANADPALRVVNHISEDLAPQMPDALRDNVDAIDYLFETYFKYNVIGLRVNTLAIGNFNAVQDFFRVLYEVKPAWESPYTNAYFKINEVWQLPTEEVEIEAMVDLADEGADTWFFDHPLYVGADVAIGADRDAVRAMSETAHDVVGFDSLAELEEPIGLAGNQWVMGGLVVLGGFAHGHVVERVDLHALVELAENVDTPDSRCQIVTQFDADPPIYLGDTLVA